MRTLRLPLPAAALAAALALQAAPPAAAADADAAIVVDPPGWASGDPEASLDALVGVVERDREGPRAQAALVVARGLWGGARDAAPLVRRLEAVAARGIPQGDADEALRRTLADLHLRAGDDAKREAAGSDAGCVLDFLVCGPFGVSAGAAVDVAYPPEKGIDLAREMPGARGPVRWVPYRNLGVGELVEPFQYLRPTDGVAYALAQVRSEASRPAVLKVTCRGAHKVLLNGAEVLRRDRIADRDARTAWVPVTLAAGWNRFLVKVVGSQGFVLKVCDAERGLPLGGTEAEKGAVLRPASPALPPPASVAYRSNLDALMAAEPATPEERALRGILEESYDLDWEAYEDLERAAKEAPGKPGVVLRFAEFVQGFGEMPEPRWRKNRARALYEDVLERSPGHVGAALALARILHGEDRTEEAIAGLKELPAPPKDAPRDPEAAKAAAESRAAMERSRRLFPGLNAILEARPRCAEAWDALCDFCQERSWWKEAEDAAERALAACPRHPGALGYLLRVAENFGNTKRAEEVLGRILAADRGNARALNALAGVRKARGDVPGALALLDEVIRRWPSDFTAREEKARTLASLERRDEAIAVWRELEALSPLEESYPRRIGDLLRLKGDADGARASWRKSLALDPGQATLRRELERLDGADFDFAKRWDVDGLAMAKECGGQEKYPKALAVHVVDLQVLRVNEDGSYTGITHNVWKILNERGREKYSEVSVPARPEDILEVRAVSPEGEVFLPIGARGSTFTLEGLQGGWIVEWRCLQDSRRGDRGFDSGGWYYQDPDFGQDADPVVLSRLVVDMPESMEPNLLLRNYGARPAPAVEGGRRTWVFEKKDMDRIEDEPRMPTAADICPWTRFYSAWTWEDVNLQAQEYGGRFRTSPLLDAKAREVAGAGGNLARAKALYDFVNREVTGNAGGWRPTGTLLEKSGNRFVLFGALLRSAGIPFDVVQVATAPEDQVLWEVLEPDHFDQTGLLVRGEDPAGTADDAYVFPFSRYTPFGRVPRQCRGKPAMIPGRRGATLFRIPGDDADLESRCTVEVALGAAPEDASFVLRLEEPGDGWFGFKETLKDANEDDRRKRATQIVGGHLESADVKEYGLPGLEDRGTNFVLEAAGAVPRMLREEGGERVLPLGFDRLDATGDYVERPERTWPWIYRGDLVRRDVVTFDLGGKWRVKRLPAGHAATSRIGTYSLTVEERDGRVRVERRVHFGDCRYTPDEYREFVGWCRALDTAEEQRIVLEEAR